MPGSTTVCPLAEPLLHDVLNLSSDSDDRAFGEAAVATRLSGYLVECHLALAHCLCKVFTVRAAALDVVPDKSDIYRHDFFLLIFL